MTPTESLYKWLESTYKHFNKTLFSSELPQVVFTVQKKNKCMGYFAPDHWSSSDGEICHEIAINPEYMTNSKLIDIFQTIAHEMCHCWQFSFGKVSRNGYHNKEWADKMESFGLIPSSTGLPGGKRTGQNMSDFPEKDGLFMKACNDHLKNSDLLDLWLYRYPLISDCSMQDEQTPESPESLNKKLCELMPGASITTSETTYSKKVKYSCMDCGLNVWGAGGLNVICGECQKPLNS